MEIKRQKIFGSKIHKQAINIAFGVDEPFVPMMGICITSILKNNPAQNFSFHIFLDNIGDRDEKNFAELCAQSPETQIILYFLPSDLYEDFYLEGNYSRAVFYRITAAEHLSDELDKIIYMDADMLCLNSLDELFKMSIEKFFLAAVADKGEWLPLHKKALGLREDYRYFNTGLLCLNLELWREEKIYERVIKEISDGKFPFADQDALNIVANKNNYPIKYIPDRYNHFFRVDGRELPLNEDVVIEHFAGQIKPWHPWCESPLKRIYDSYQKISPWRDFIYSPRNYQEHRLMGRVCRREGKWFEALKWYYSYLKRRRVEKNSKRG